jgi:hypothetical protein
MPDEKVKSVIADAHKWVLDCSQKFDMILMDINYEESNINISPPAKFLEQAFLDKLMVRHKVSFCNVFRAFQLELFALTWCATTKREPPVLSTW